ncbi:MAG: hypothetical protein IPH13_02335 [Planctomycetes bacterium]|nr:hypothetical protein [Planctomycetota bacterium]
MQPKTICLASAWIAALGSSSTAALAGLHVVDAAGVSGSFISLQAALDAAAPGDVIEVRGGEYAAITITKSVTILGAPRPTIRPPSPSEAAFHCSPAITLAGTGVGVVTLVDLDIGGLGAADWFSVFHAAIEGGGFTALRIHECIVSGPDLVYATGIGVGAEAIRTTVPLLYLCDCQIAGGENSTDVGCAAMPSGRFGIDAPNSTVVVLDSVVSGGLGSDHVACFDAFCGTSQPAQPCPCAWLGGGGGDGIRAQRVFVANSIVNGGMGMTVTDTCGLSGTLWGTQPDGAPFAAGTIVTTLRNDLALSGSIQLGGTANLAWTPGTSQLVLVSSGFGAPTDDANGTMFVDPTQLVFVDGIASGIAAASVPIPADAALIGIGLVVQVFDPNTGLTRPVADVIRP